MNITFLVGNGFDLNLGLDTRYVDFYPYFIAHAANDNMIKDWLSEDNLLWSDLEEQLGQNLQKLDINNMEKFYEDKEELDELLLEYLEQEQGRVSFYGNTAKIAEEFTRSLLNFKEGLSGIDEASVEEICKEHRGKSYTYQFISFNYTDLLDQFINIVWEKKSEMIAKNGNGREHHLSKKVLHIHGTLEREMILGVNDLSQINNALLTGNNGFLDTFIKERLNKNLGQRRTEIAEKMIQESDIICIYGMSIGCTDRMWWKRIIDWLYFSTYHKLIVYYKDGHNRSSSQRIIRAKNSVKDKMLENANKGTMGLPAIKEIKSKICVSYNPDIFNFRGMLHL